MGLIAYSLLECSHVQSEGERRLGGFLSEQQERLRLWGRERQLLHMALPLILTPVAFVFMAILLPGNILFDSCVLTPIGLAHFL